MGNLLGLSTTKEKLEKQDGCEQSKNEDGKVELTDDLDHINYLLQDITINTLSSTVSKFYVCGY